MDGKRRRSRKPSGRASRPPERHVYFVDRALGRKVVATVLSEAGFRVEIHDDHFAQDVVDETWLREVGRRGWIVLTKDDRIRYRGPERAAVADAGVRVFALTSGNLKGAEMAAAFLKSRSRMERLVRREKSPFIATVTRAGTVALWRGADELLGK